jgi:hypothetical protein
MAEDDLTSIPGLRDRHRRFLNARLQITTLDALAGADPQAIFSAMSRIRPRPTLDDVRGWQEKARRRRDKAQRVETPGWERAATFVLSFEQRYVEGPLERRLAAEQTELEPEQPPSLWPGWECGGLCEWLQQRVGEVEPTGQAEPPSPAEASGRAEAPQPPGAAVTGGGGELRFENVAIVDSTGRFGVVSEGRPAGQELGCTLPGRLEIRVAGASPDREVRVALRFRRPGRPGWSPQEPATVPAQGPAELVLSDVAPGQYRARLVAWAPDASAQPIGVELGTLTIRGPGP